MYEAFFHLDRRPFVASPRTEHYFPARSIEQARQSLTRCISRCEGPGAIIGPSGTGKSLLCFVLAKQFRDRMKVVVVQGGRLRTRKSLLQNVLYELKQPFREMDEDELRLSLLDYLEAKDSAQKRLLLIVDDAHLLRGQVLLDIAALCSHVREGEPLIQFVLAGGSALEEKLAHPRLESLQQRIAARCYLQALNYDETVAYIRAQVEHCGGQLDGVMASEAVHALYRASDGVPRLINQVGDHALLLAYLAKLRPVTKAAIEEAWSDLQQLPTPWQVTDHPAAVAAKEEATSIIEFGSLEEPEPIAPTPPPQSMPPIAPSQPIEPVSHANPVFSAEQNLWTIESGLARLHEAPTSASAPALAPLATEAPAIALELSGWGDAAESDFDSVIDPPSSLLESEISMRSPAMPTVQLKAPSTPSPVAVKPNLKVNAAPVTKRIANPFEGQFEAEEVINDGVSRRAAAKSTIAAAPLSVRVENAEPSTAAPMTPVLDEDRFEQFDGVSVDWMNYQATSVVGMGVVGMGVAEDAPADASGGDAWNVISIDGDSAAAGARYDDRDTLLVENDQPPRIRPVKRQEFRQLFAKMRGEN